MMDGSVDFIDFQVVSQVAGLEDVIVPAGRFNAIKVIKTTTRIDGQHKRKSAADFPIAGISWFAEGVGLIKSVSRSGSPPRERVTELVAYKVKALKGKILDD